MPGATTTPAEEHEPPEAQNLSTDTMDKATAYQIVAADRKFSSVAELNKALDQWEAAKPETTKRISTDDAATAAARLPADSHAVSPPLGLCG